MQFNVIYCSTTCRKEFNEKSGFRITNEWIRSKKLKNKSKVKKKKKKLTKSQRKLIRAESEAFYYSREWLRLRYKVIQFYGGKCMACRSTGRIHVDHIKPKSKYPELALNFLNLQVLCQDCNMGKSNLDETDWRPK